MTPNKKVDPPSRSMRGSKQNLPIRGDRIRPPLPESSPNSKRSQWRNSWPRRGNPERSCGLALPRGKTNGQAGVPPNLPPEALGGEEGGLDTGMARPPLAHPPETHGARNLRLRYESEKSIQQKNKAGRGSVH